MKNYIQSEVIDGVPQLTLNTMMTSKIFMQSKIITYMQAPGSIYRAADDSFIPWQWAATKESYIALYKNPVIFIQGDNFNGRLLADILDAHESDAYAAVRNVIGILQKAAERNIPISTCGAASIICGDNGDVLFLPAEIVSRTLQHQGDSVYAQYCCQYCNPGLDPVRAQSFMAGVLLYQALCGKVPFYGKLPDEVFMDIADGNFQLPEQAVPGIQKKISDYIVRLLDQQPEICDKKKKNIKIQTPVISLDSILAKLPVQQDKCFEIISDDEKETLQQKAAETATKQVSRIAFIRSLRKAKPVIIGGCVVAVLLGLLLQNILSSIKNRPTTTGMTAAQVVERFYTGISNLDQQWPDACCAKTAKTPLTDMVINLYVMYRQTEFYAKERRLYSPGEWWNLEDVTQKHMFGITNLHIEEIPVENGNPDVPTEAFMVSYYLITPEIPPELIPDGQEGALETNSIFPLSVARREESVTVSLQTNKWLISSFAVLQDKPVYIDRESFFAARIPGSVTSDCVWGPSLQEIADGNAALYDVYFK